MHGYMAWDYHNYVGPALSEAALKAQGAQNWELIAVLPPLLATIPVGTQVGALPANDPAVFPPLQTQVAVAYDLNKYTYIFKRPL